MPSPPQQAEPDPDTAEHGVPAGCGEVAVVIQGSPAALAAFERARQRIAEQMEKMRVVCEPLLSSAEEVADTYRRMAPWQRQAWRRLTMREVKQRLDAQDAVRRARRRPVDRSVRRSREQGRGRSRVTRAGPSDDPDPDDLGPPRAGGRLEVAR
jgi:hypothetical protein